MVLRANPFVRLLLPLALGIACGSGCTSVSSSSYLISLLCTAFAVVFWARRKYAYSYRWWFGVCLYAFLFAAGFCRAQWHHETSAAHHFGRFVSGERLHASVLLELSGPLSPGKWLQAPARVLGISDSSGFRQVSGNLQLFLKGDSCSFRYGDRIWLEADVQKAGPPLNPDAFDYRHFLHVQNIHFTAFAELSGAHLLSRDHGWIWWRWAYFFRGRLLERLRQYFPTENEFAVASALLAGYRAELPDELREAYTNTGSMHALAVSGTHVGILYAGLLFLLSQLPFYGSAGYYARAAILLLAIWGFALLTGGSPSVMRAAVMFSFYLIGKAIRRDASVWNVLAGSAFGLLLLDPFYLFSVGFQLSYTAVAGMVFFYPRLYKLAPILPRIPDEAVKILLVGISAQLGTLPLSLYYFHQFPCYFWLAGWVVILGGMLFLWGGAILVVLDVSWPSLAAILGKGLFWILHSMNFLIDKIQLLPGSVLSGIWLLPQTLYALVAAMLAMGFALAFRQGRLVLVGLCFFCAAACTQAVHWTSVQNQAHLVIYHNRGGLLIDVISGFHVWEFRVGLEDRQVDFSAGNHRIASGVSPGSVKTLDASSAGFLYEKKQIFIAGASFEPPPDLGPVDVLVLTENSPIDLTGFLQTQTCMQVVIASDNSWYRQRKWMEVCTEIDIPVHLISSAGAFIVDLKKPR